MLCLHVTNARVGFPSQVIKSNRALHVPLALVFGLPTRSWHNSQACVPLGSFVERSGGRELLAANAATGHFYGKKLDGPNGGVLEVERSCGREYSARFHALPPEQKQ